MVEFGYDTEAEAVVQAYGDRVKGKTIVITGGSATGLGATTAIALAAAQPAHIILTAQHDSAKKVESVLSTIQQASPSTKADFVGVNLEDFAQVRAAATKISSLVDRIDILINNAGVIAIPYTGVPFEDRVIEKTLAVNYLGPFLLTNLLIKAVHAAAPGARIINLASSAHKIAPIQFDDVNFSSGETYDRWVAYGQSKTALTLFTRSLAARHGSKGVLAYSVHPGMILSTPFCSHLQMEDFQGAAITAAKLTGASVEADPKSVTQGAATIVFAALSPTIENDNGAYLESCKLSPETEMPYARDMEQADRIWRISEDLLGEKFSA